MITRPYFELDGPQAELIKVDWEALYWADDFIYEKDPCYWDIWMKNHLDEYYMIESLLPLWALGEEFYWNYEYAQWDITEEFDYDDV
jgi:hypothetical protein